MVDPTLFVLSKDQCYYGSCKPQGALMERIDTKTLLMLVSMGVNFTGVIGTWAVMQYRLDDLEEAVSTLEKRVSATEAANIEQIERVKCLICEANDIRCPGCGRD